MLDYLELAHTLRAAGQPFVIATVVRAERPTSAKPGATAIVTADGKLTGWVGGSCAQPTVVREALRVLQAGQPVLLRMGPPDLANPAGMGRAEAPGVLERPMTCISGGTLDIYLEPHLAQPLLVAISHLPIAEALAAFGKGLGYAVTVAGLDVTPERFPQADRVVDGLAFAQIPLRPQTYIVAASHGNYDEEALTWALSTSAQYVALVASPKRARAVVETLRELGIAEERLARLKFPAGLDLGAVTPEEIALSILAETVQLRRRGPAHPVDEAAAKTVAAAKTEATATAEAQLAAQRHGPGAGPLIAPSVEAIDPVCGMTVEIAGARYASQYQGQTYYFCAASCKRSFEKDPQKYVV
jgi:xanthine dehydrogenase accessory factor